jgi:putative phage-type endonuclease
MIIVNLVQGTPEWHKHRAKHFNASDAPAMMGSSKYKTRSELLKEMATGIKPEVDSFTQKRFDDGHKAEDFARSITEVALGEELYPVTGTLEVDSLQLSASFDGLTMDESVIFEHKLWNQELAEAVKQKELPAAYFWQLEHQLLVSGASEVLFVCSDGTEKNRVEMKYTSLPERRAELIAGWKQFAIDLENYEHKEAKAEPTGKAPESLPALNIEVKGMVTASNIDAFKSHALAVFGAINKDLQTDGDFADAEKTVKWCKEVEDKLEAAKQHALSQTADIDALFRAIDDISTEARRVRLDLDKLVKTRKENIRIEIMREAETAFAAHVSTINARLGKVQLPAVKTDFAGVMKGKKTVQSLRDALDGELARAKIEASQLSELIGANVTTLRDMAVGFEYLFMDAQQICQKANDDLVLLIKSRIAEHKAAEEASQKAKAEAEEKAAAEAQEIAMVADSITQPITEKTKSNKRTRPTDAQIIEAVANAFGTSEQEALDWILNMQTREAA